MRFNIWDEFFNEYWDMVDWTVEVWNKPMMGKVGNLKEFVEGVREIFSR